MDTHGKLILFGSGETSPTGKQIHRKIFQSFLEKQTVAVLEIPAGFQPNSAFVAEEIANMFQKTVPRKIAHIGIVPARKKGTNYSPDNEILLEQLTYASYIFLGPGSPTYTVRNLKETKALSLLTSQWEKGATLCLSSAAAMAFGEYVLPVYEIYKAGEDLFWEKGLNVLNDIGLSVSIITHWNNKEGGKHLDTRFCYMGEKRFETLKTLLPHKTLLLGIDEHTAIVFDFKQHVFYVEGVGSITLVKKSKSITFPKGTYSLDSLQKGIVIKRKRIVLKREPISSVVAKPKSLQSLVPELIQLLLEREEAKKRKDFVKADIIREEFKKRKYRIEDTNKGQEVYDEIV